jgi:hypothetical protein
MMRVLLIAIGVYVGLVLLGVAVGKFIAAGRGPR